MTTFSISSKSRTFTTLDALNTAKDDLTLVEGNSWRLAWITDTGGTKSVVGKISAGKLEPHPLKTGFLPSRVIGEGAKGYTILDATRVSTDSNGDLVISHGPLTAAGDFVRVLLINGVVIDRNVDKIITVWDVVLTTPTNDMGIFQRIEGSAAPTNWGQVGILRTAGSWVSDLERSSDSTLEQIASTTPGTSFRVEMHLIHGTGSVVAASPEAQTTTGDVGSEGALTSALTFDNITDWDTTADFRISFATLDITGGGAATFTLKELWVVPNDGSLGSTGGGAAVSAFDDVVPKSANLTVTTSDAGESDATPLGQLTGDGAPIV